MDARLPIYDVEERLLGALREGRRVVLAAPTGSGKSTQVPQMLLKHGLLDRGEVVVLQPRRLAARLLAARVAEELGSRLGETVGYQVRLENVSGPKTRIRFVTEGILLRRMIADPDLDGVGVLIFDEFHERHLYGDISLAQALELQASRRPDLKLIVMSATLDLDRLRSYLEPCTVISSEGRTHPVELRYHPPARPTDEPAIWDLAADAFAAHVAEGDALVFMPGGYEIMRTIEAIRERPEARGRVLLPLHGELPPRDQDAAVARHERPKVVVATNVAETSLTIDGVRLVIDSGLARIPRYDPQRGINTLLIERISRASAEQRAGRAGRTAPGVCVRLWSEREQAQRPARETPEVKRLDLAEVVLTLKSAGVKDLKAFRWIDAPGDAALADAEELLHDLGALREGAITPLGRRMLAFPLHPRYSRMLLAAEQEGCVREAALAAALTQGRDLLLRNVDAATSALREREFESGAKSDLEVIRRAWTWAAKQDFRWDACRRAGIHAVTARQVGPLFDQILSIAKEQGLGSAAGSTSADEALRRCVLQGFPDRLARRCDEGTLRCDLVHGRRGLLARESVVRKSPLLVAAEIREVEVRGELQTLLSLAASAEREWIDTYFPGETSTRTAVSFDPGARRVIAEEQRVFRGLVLESKRVEPPPADAAARLLAAEVLSGRLLLHGWDDACEQWILRASCVAKACPELGLPAFGEEDRRAVFEQLCLGETAYKDLKDKPVLPVLQGWWSGAQRALVEKHAPERIELPGGRRPKVTYAADAPPWFATRLQDLYGVTQTPRIAMGRVALVVHLLAPNQRPVQVTQDLAGFWRETYPQVKKELQRRYPKHEWR